MDKLRILSGEEIVSKGATKIEVTLPDIGLKDVTPDGSWLEQKQIQSALEARKLLVEVPRIEKSGILNHAEWREDLKLAEVIKQAGNFWQFLGHCKDKKLYLRPEETLFLMEVNCLLLRYNEVVVSLQQAYSLLLSDQISIIQYKVYGSLSRLGYKVFRYVMKPVIDEASTIISETCSIQELEPEIPDKMEIESAHEPFNDKEFKNDKQVSVEVKEHEKENGINMQNKENDSGNKPNAVDAMLIDEQIISNENKQSNQIENNSPTETVTDVIDKDFCSTQNTSTEPEAMITGESASMTTNNVINSTENSDLRTDHTITITNEEKVTDDTVCDNISSVKTLCTPGPSHISNVNPLARFCQWKLQKLKSRQSMTSSTLDVHRSFINCPDLLENQIVTIHKPKEEYTPNNIILNNLHYVINIENVRTKNRDQANSNDSTYSLPDEVNGAHIRRVTSSFMYDRPQTLSAQTSVNFPSFFQTFRPNIPFRHYNFWRPRPNMNYFQFNMIFQRPFLPNFNPRFQFLPGMHMPMFSRYTMSNVTTDSSVTNAYRATPNNNRKRRKDHAKDVHLQNLKNLAMRLKQLNNSGTMKTQNIQAIQSLIDTYNVRFRTRLRLSEQCEIVSDETIVDTITLDDDDDMESNIKKPKLDDKTDFFHENLNKIRQAAFKLKNLEVKSKSSARHRRALSSVIKTFNKCFDADIYMTENYDVLDRRHINLDSSSESDCVIEETPKVRSGKQISGKKLRNPFNILKRLSEKHVSNATSRQETPESPTVPSSPKFHEVLEKSFNKTWLPNNNDFGRPEIIPRDTMTARIIETKKEELLFDFLKNEPYKFSNWVDIKIAFLESIEETNAILHTEAMIENNHIDLKSLVEPEDCTDMSTVLKKLSIIQSNKMISNETVLSIHFDVYNRDVQNFRKTDRPTPHFRIVCIDESSPWPAGIDIATLHSSIKDDVTLIFAIVGISSISYVQLNPVDLPVYVPSSDLG